MEQKYKIGDVVTLKSGSPDMTITNDKVGNNLKTGKFWNGQYICKWFYENDIKQDVFPQEALESDEI